MRGGIAEASALGLPDAPALAPVNPLEEPMKELVEWGRETLPELLPYATDPTYIGIGAAAVLGTLAVGTLGSNLALTHGARALNALGHKLDRRPGVIGVARRVDGGRVTQKAKPLVTLSFKDRCMHVQIVAPTRQGKTSLILPWIEQDLRHHHTVIIIQTGGDLGSKALALADALGMPVHYLNPADPATEKWNPLVGAGASPADLAEQATATLEAIAASNNIFYEKNNTVILRKMVLAAHAYARANGTEPNLAMVWRWLESEDRLMEDLRVRAHPGGRFSVEFEALDDKTRSWFENRYLRLSPKDRDDRTVGLYNVLDDMLGRDVVEDVLTSGPDDTTIDVKAASQGGGLILCDIPAADVGDVPSMTLATWFLMRVMQDLEKRKVRYPVCLYLDEMQLILGRANSRAAQRFERWITGIGKYGVAVHVAYQGFSQLSEPLQDVLENNATHKFFSGRLGDKDARKAQQIIGSSEVEVEDVRHTKGHGGHGSFSVGTRTVLRPRKTIDEIKKLPRPRWHLQTATDGNLLDPMVVEALPVPEPASKPLGEPAAPKKHPNKAPAGGAAR
ncbi:MAG: type IV secretory system conjugative DNA transfer family protein [Actinomycetota bacterium]|nr:type IV secretory system conjugative DNA transfer family protein [Actinomycetota bacterium]